MTSRLRALILPALLLFALPLRAAPDPLAEIQQIQQQADAIKAQAEACSKMKCPVCDCASLAKMMQALVDAEAVLDALHGALIDANADARKHYYDLAANSHLTGVKLAQLQDSLAWQEFFHKLGSYLLKMESILNTLTKNIGSFDVKGVAPTNLDASQALERLDSLANLAKNLGDIGADLTNQIATGEVPSTPEAKELINSKWDVKSEGVDLGKVAREAHDAFKEGGAKEMFDKLKESRNVLTLLARTLKVYSEKKIKDEKAVLKDLQANEGPEAEALTRAFQEWQRVREQMAASEDALASTRAARAALTACLANAKCGSMTLSRPALGPFKSYGEALPVLFAKLPATAAALKGGISVQDKCPEPGKTPEPPKEKPGPTGTTPLPPPKHVVENDCPKCSGIALELARTLDQRDFVVAEITRIRQNVAKAEELEKDAKILRDAIQRITQLIIDFRQGKKGKNALISAGNAIFDKLGKPHTEITIEKLEREKRDRQNDLQTLEQKTRALRAEEGRLAGLQKENDRLYDLAEKLRADLAECQKSCVPPPPPKMTKCAVDKSEFDHWNQKQQKYPSDANRNQRDAALKKLCECLKAHPEDLTDELRKLCPDKSIGMAPPRQGKVGNCLLGFVYSADAGPGDRICGTIVDNPKDYKDSPRVRVVEILAELPVDDAGKPILRETTVSFDGGPAQPGDGPVGCKIPPSGTTNVSIGKIGEPPVGRTPITCPGGPATTPPTEVSTPPVCVNGEFLTIEGPFSGDPKNVRIEVSGRRASIVTGTPRDWNCLLPDNTPPGEATVVYEENGKRMTAKVTVLALLLSADRTDLMRGQSTPFQAKVLGLGGIPDEQWTKGSRIQLILENRSPESITMDGEKEGRIVIWIERSNVTNGTFEFKGKIRSKQRGLFNIHATVLPKMAPVKFSRLATN